MRIANAMKSMVTAAVVGGGLCCFSLVGCNGDAGAPGVTAESSTEATESETPAKKPDVAEATPATPDTQAAPPQLALGNTSSDAEKDEPQQPQLAPEGIWTSDYKQALAKAKKEGKDVLMNFTGSDWCGYCIELHDKVFQFKEFSDFATKKFVLLELDFPNDSSHMTQETQAQNAELQGRFSIEGYPTILLVDAEGRPYARTGFAPVGPKEYVAHLDELTAVRAKRDKILAEAAKLSGTDKAKKLDEALKTLPEEFVFTSYDGVVEEILKLDADNAAGLRDEYKQQLMLAKLRDQLREVQTLLQTTGEVSGALKKLDEIQAEFVDFEPAQAAANQFRLQLLQLDGQTDEVVKLADKLLADKNTKGESRLPIFSAKLNALAQAEKFAAALIVTDDMRKEFGEDKSLAARLLVARADLLSKMKRTDEARKAIDEARALGNDELSDYIDQAEREIFDSEDEAGESGDGPQLESLDPPAEEPQSDAETEPAENE